MMPKKKLKNLAGAPRLRNPLYRRVSCLLLALLVQEYFAAPLPAKVSCRIFFSARVLAMIEALARAERLSSNVPVVPALLVQKYLQGSRAAFRACVRYDRDAGSRGAGGTAPRQYLYFCTSKASKLS
jgi:hypothetical protein